MIYKDLYNDFKILFPDWHDTFEKLKKDSNADENDGMHIMFSFVVIPFVLFLLKENKTEEAEKAFEFFEKMAFSDNAEITEVLEFTVIENLMSHGYQTYENAKKYMGSEMIKSCNMIEKYLNAGK